MIYPAFAAEYDLNSYHADDDSNESSEYSQIVSTSDGTLDVGIYTIPAIPNIDEPTKLMISFLKPDTERIQLHIDYRVSVTKDGDYVFGPMSRLLHTSPGTITIPVQFSENGSHIVHIEIEGILFQPLSLETATLTINVGQAETSIPGWIKNNAGWWAEDKISEVEFVNAIQYLIKHGIIIVNDGSLCVNDLSEIFGDSIVMVQNTCNLHESTEYSELIPAINKINYNSLGFRGAEFSNH